MCWKRNLSNFECGYDVADIPASSCSTGGLERISQYGVFRVISGQIWKVSIIAWKDSMSAVSCRRIGTFALEMSNNLLIFWKTDTKKIMWMMSCLTWTSMETKMCAPSFSKPPLAALCMPGDWRVGEHFSAQEEGEALQHVLRKKLRWQVEREQNQSLGESWSDEEDLFADSQVQIPSRGLHGDDFAMVNCGGDTDLRSVVGS